MIVNTIVSLLETYCTRNSASWFNHCSFNCSSRHNSVICKTQLVHDLSPLCQSLHNNFIKPSLPTSNEGFDLLFESFCVCICFFSYILMQINKRDFRLSQFNSMFGALYDAWMYMPLGGENQDSVYNAYCKFLL